MKVLHYMSGFPAWGFDKVKVKVKSLSHVQLFATPGTVAYYTPQSMGFSRQEYWSGLSFPSPDDLPNLGTKPVSPVLAGRCFFFVVVVVCLFVFTTESPGKPKSTTIKLKI